MKLKNKVTFSEEKMNDDFCVYFVDSNENNEKLQEAMEKMSKSDFKYPPQWLTSEECLKIKEKGKNVYIFDPFEGPAFEHLKNLGCSIYGPQCIICSLERSINLPRKKKYPIYNLAMHGLIVCCTSIVRETREQINEKVKLMGGDVESSLTNLVTHLVAGEVGSSKYMAAVKNSKTVMTKEWIDAVWTASQSKYILGTDKIFDKYKCPVFLGLVIVVSGFNSFEKNAIKALVLKGGGRYSGEMKMNECTHLIVKEPKGPKYEAAKNWKINIVNDRWLYDSMDKGKLLDPLAYQLSTKTSTPEKASSSAPYVGDISGIEGNTSSLSVDETNLMATRRSEQFTFIDSRSDVAETKLYETLLGITNVSEIFLDSCKIFLSGVRSPLSDKLKKLINSAGGLVSTKLSNDITHVIVETKVESDLSAIRKLKNSPLLVSPEWLVECCQQGNIVPEDKYFIDSDTSKSFTDKKLDISKQNVSQKPKRTEEKTNTVTGSFGEAPSDMEMANLLSQYLSQDVTAKGVDVDNERTMEPEAKEKTLEDDQMTQNPNVSCVDEANEGNMFRKKTFVLLGFSNEEYDEMCKCIEERSGKVVNLSKWRKVVDLAIVPLFGYPVDVTVTDIVTNAWLHVCIQSEELLPLDECWFFRPLEFSDCDVLKGCCISISGYAGIERDCLMMVGQTIGADVEMNFAKKQSKTAKASTHLIVDKAEGSKYTASKKWGIPAVGKEWLFACAEAGAIVPIENFLIEVLEAAAQKNDNNESASSGKNETDLSKTKQAQAIQEKPEEAVPPSSTESESTEVNPMAQFLKSESWKPCVSKGACQPNQSENISAGRQTKQSENMADGQSVTPWRCLYRQKMQSSDAVTPTDHMTPTSKTADDQQTDGNFLKPEVRAKCNINVNKMFGPDTPASEMSKQTPIRSCIERGVQQAGENWKPLQEEWEEKRIIPSQTQEDKPALRGIVIAVAKKLGKHHTEYNEIVQELGGEYSWECDQTVTHFIFQGRVNDTNKEFRMARQCGKIIVHPHWLIMCKEQNCCVDESVFPHYMKSDTTIKQTPSLSIRASSRNKSKETPSKKQTKHKPQLDLQVVSSQLEQTPRANASRVTRQRFLQTSPEESEQVEVLSEDKESLHKTVNEDGDKPAATDLGKESPFQKPSTPPSKDKRKTPTTSPVVETESNELKEALSKSLGSAMEGVTRSKKQKKSSYEYSKYLSDQTDSPEDTPSRSLFKHRRSANLDGKNNEIFTEPSQSLQITWDDPTERLEKQKLAHKLMTVHEPSQNTDDFLIAAVDDHPAQQQRKSRSPSPAPALTEATETVDPNDFESDHEEIPEPISASPVFILSGLSQQDRISYAALIECLGGRSIDRQCVDIQTTHLVVAQPARNEKCLSAVAAGIWVLHVNYLNACKKAGCFVQESDYEWGNTNTNFSKPSLSEQALKLAMAAKKWRCRIQQLKEEKRSNVGAFSEWKCLLALDKSKEECFKRVLEAGGASVSLLRSPVPESLEATHAFIDIRKQHLSQQDLQRLERSNISCLKTEYIPSFLCDEPLPNPQEFKVSAPKTTENLPEISRLRKRKSSNDDQNTAKMAKR